MPRAAKCSDGETKPAQFRYISAFGLPRLAATRIAKAQADSHHDAFRVFLAQLTAIRSVLAAGKFPVFRKRRQSELARFLRKAAVLWAKVKNRYEVKAAVPGLLDRVARGTLHEFGKSINYLGRPVSFVRIVP